MLTQESYRNEANLLSFAREWKVNFVDDITKRESYEVFLFTELPKDNLYDLHIDYKIARKNSIHAEGLTYNGLINKIFDYLVVHQQIYMNIFVAQHQGGTE